jgi:hypothetical protein
LFPGEEVWTEEHAQELVQRFNEDQLVDERSFEEKLATQLGRGSRAATRLIAEIVAAYFSFATHVGGAGKRELMGFVHDRRGPPPHPPRSRGGRAPCASFQSRTPDCSAPALGDAARNAARFPDGRQRPPKLQASTGLSTPDFRPRFRSALPALNTNSTLEGS